MATVADHIDSVGKTSELRELIADDVKLHMSLYHRKIALAATLRRKLANPHSRKVNLRIDLMWYASVVSKPIVQSAAADLAAAKAMLKAQELYDGMFTARTADAGGGMDLDG